MNARKIRQQAGPVYLVVMKETVVAQDIAGAIADARPGARIVIVASPAEARSALAGVDRLAAAFVSAAPQTFLGSSLAKAIAQRGGQVVLMGDEAEEQGGGPGWSVLHRPFTTKAVLAQLPPVTRRPPGALAAAFCGNWVRRKLAGG